MIGLFATQAVAQTTYYWAPTGTFANGGAGTWTATNTWRTGSSTGAQATYADGGNTVIFSGTASGTVSMPSIIQVNTIRLDPSTTSGVTITLGTTGSNIEFVGGSAFVYGTPGRTLQFSTGNTGTFTMAAGGTLTFDGGGTINPKSLYRPSGTTTVIVTNTTTAFFESNGAFVAGSGNPVGPIATIVNSGTLGVGNAFFTSPITLGTNSAGGAVISNAGGGTLRLNNTTSNRLQGANATVTVGGTSTSKIIRTGATYSYMTGSSTTYVGQFTVNATGDPSGIDLDYQDLGWRQGTIDKLGAGTMRLTVGGTFNNPNDFTTYLNTGTALRVTQGTFRNEGLVMSIANVAGGLLTTTSTTGTFDQVNVTSGTFEIARSSGLFRDIVATGTNYAAGNNALNLRGGTLRYNGVNTDYSASMGNLGGVASTIDTNTQDVSFATGLTGTGGLTKAGAGTLTLNGANTYTGATTVNAGVLALGANDVLSASTAVTVSGGGLNLATFTDTVASLTITSGSLFGSGTLTASAYTLSGGTVAGNLGAGTLTVTANSTLSGVAGAGTVNLNAGTLTLSSGGRLSPSAAVSGSSGASLALGGNETIGSLSGTAGVTLGSNTLTVGDATTTTYAGVLAGSGGGLTKQGIGTLTLAGANTYTGATTVNAGILALGASDRLSNSTAVTIAGGGLNLSTFADTVSSFTITSGSLFGSGTLTAATYALAGGTTAGNLGAGTLTVTANSTLSGVSGANTVNLNAGTLTLSSGGRLSPSAAVSGSSGASLALGGNETIGSLAGAAGISLGSGLLTVGGANTSTTYSGQVSGAGGLTKVGTSTLILDGLSTFFTGTTAVNAGELRLNGAVGGDVNVLAGAIFGGSGRFADLSGDGLVAPGNSPGILTGTGAVNPTGGLDFAFEISGTLPLWSNATASVNDVLRIMDPTAPFTTSLATGVNTVSVYLDVASLSKGTQYLGGFFTDRTTGLLADVQGADWVFYVSGTGGGAVNYNGINYYALNDWLASPQNTGGVTGISVAVLTVLAADFAGGTVSNGQVTAFVVVPEPAAVVGGVVGLAAVAWAARRRRARGRVATAPAAAP